MHGNFICWHFNAYIFVIKYLYIVMIFSYFEMWQSDMFYAPIRIVCIKLYSCISSHIDSWMVLSLVDIWYKFAGQMEEGLYFKIVFDGLPWSVVRFKITFSFPSFPYFFSLFLSLFSFLGICLLVCITDCEVWWRENLRAPCVFKWHLLGGII